MYTHSILYYSLGFRLIKIHQSYELMLPFIRLRLLVSFYFEGTFEVAAVSTTMLLRGNVAIGLQNFDETVRKLRSIIYSRFNIILL